jgi:hypothetical protein
METQLAASHNSPLDSSEKSAREIPLFPMGLRLILGLPLALALPKLSPTRLQTGETEGRRICPQIATAVRSPSGGGGGGFDFRSKPARCFLLR